MKTKVIYTFTALDILKLAGVEKPEEKIGKMSVVIAGIRGINEPQHLIKLPVGTEKIDIIVGEDSYTIEELPESEGNHISDGARKAIKTKGEIATAKSKELSALKSKKKEEKK